LVLKYKQKVEGNWFKGKSIFSLSLLQAGEKLTGGALQPRASFVLFRKGGEV
jgi:hypothetical protein